MSTRDEILAVYDGSDGEATSALYRRLEALGPAGVIAMNIFRAHKSSARAKLYSRRYKGAAYGKKDYSLGLLCSALGRHAEALGIRWGWAVDAKQEVHKHVLYVDLPTGQVSFHTEHRLEGPDYTGEWDGAPVRIARYAAGLLDGDQRGHA